MFVGHTAVALAARSRTRDVSLGWFMTATFALDLLWPIFLLAGIEHVRAAPGATAFTPLEFVSYPWSHSLVMAAVWGLVLMAAARWRRVPAPQAWWLAAVVVSHWVLDFVAHGPDMPLWPGTSPRVGLGLWNSIPGTFLVEGALFAAGVTMYVRSHPARDGIGRWAFRAFIAFSIVIWAMLPWMPPPDDPRQTALFSFSAWLLIAWTWWADRHRADG